MLKFHIADINDFTIERMSLMLTRQSLSTTARYFQRSFYNFSISQLFTDGETLLIRIITRALETQLSLVSQHVGKT